MSRISGFRHTFSLLEILPFGPTSNLQTLLESSCLYSSLSSVWSCLAACRHHTWLARPSGSLSAFYATEPLDWRCIERREALWEVGWQRSSKFGLINAPRWVLIRSKLFVVWVSVQCKNFLRLLETSLFVRPLKVELLKLVLSFILVVR